MLLASSPDGSRINAAPQLQGACPLCLSSLIAKCGEVVRWHWAHHANPECDDWHSLETDWHREWKSRFPVECQEVILEKRGKRHRADIRTCGEMILEFQNSPISIADVRARESFYGSRMAWVFNCSMAFGDGRLVVIDRDRFHSFRWSHPKRTPQRCVRPVFFDLGDDEILDVRRIYGDTRTTGWGYIRTYQEFVDAMTLTNPRGWMDMLCRGVDGMDDLVVVS